MRGPEDSLKRRDSIHVGSIFKMEFTPSEGVKPKNPGETSRIKYFVIIGIDGDRVFVGALLINSRINDRLFLTLTVRNFIICNYLRISNFIKFIR